MEDVKVELSQGNITSIAIYRSFQGNIRQGKVTKFPNEFPNEFVQSM